eukprot:TRINITY_DN6597_c0_g1_i1.p1 TRINITY_DN6597_c0_g1~~TRINITY_DN6597_c0_g1_i1.p1  ORF type:complete len:683 (+),score=97.13 TRINITY_DN6597_c0_g1_i1:53-2050(+)
MAPKSGLTVSTASDLSGVSARSSEDLTPGSMTLNAAVSCHVDEVTSTRWLQGFLARKEMKRGLRSQTQVQPSSPTSSPASLVHRKDIAWKLRCHDLAHTATTRMPRPSKGPQELLQWLHSFSLKFWGAEVSIDICLRPSFAPGSHRVADDDCLDTVKVLRCIGLSHIGDAAVSNSPHTKSVPWFGTRVTASLPWYSLSLDEHRCLEHCFTTGERLVDHYNSVDGRWRFEKHNQIAKKRTWYSVLYLAIRASDGCIGVIRLKSPSFRDFAPSDQEAFMAVVETFGLHLQIQRMHNFIEVGNQQHAQTAKAYREMLNDRLPSQVVDELYESKSHARASLTLPGVEVRKRPSLPGKSVDGCRPDGYETEVAKSSTWSSGQNEAASHRSLGRVSRCDPVTPHTTQSHIAHGLDKLAYAEYHESVVILFVKGFSSLAEKSNPAKTMVMLDELFGNFDDILAGYSPLAFKVEAVGDVYMIALGLFRGHGDAGQSFDPPFVVFMALSIASEMVQAAAALKMPDTTEHEHDSEVVQIRVGMHIGRIMSGIVGKKVPRYCVLGDTVNSAASMESTGIAGMIHVTEDVRQVCQSHPCGTFLQFYSRGCRSIEGKGRMHTYLVDPAALKGGSTLTQAAVTKAEALAEARRRPALPAPALQRFLSQAVQLMCGTSDM